MIFNRRFSFFFVLLAATFLSSDENMGKEGSSPKKEEGLFNIDRSAVYVSGEFLYWTVSEGALDYALVMKNPAWASSSVYANGDFERAKFDWDPGFRVALGYFHSYKLMNLWGEYTRLRVKNSNSVNRPSDSNLFLTGTFPQILDTLSSARSHIRMSYDLLDFLVARVFIPNPHLRIRLLGGLTGVILKQKWNVKYYDSSYMTETKNRWRFFGGGLKIGLGIDWFWIRDFYLTGRAVFGLLVGKYKNYAVQRTTADDVSRNITIPFRDTKYEHYRPSFTVQFLMGPSWQKVFPHNRIEIFAGYELNEWFNLHEIFRSFAGGPNDSKQTIINRELLALHGLTARVTVDF